MLIHHMIQVNSSKNEWGNVQISRQVDNIKNVLYDHLYNKYNKATRANQ